MARPFLNMSDETLALWEDACARWQRGEVTADELAAQLGISRRTVYYRLQDAQQRIELRVLDENQDRHESRIQQTSPDPQGLPDQKPGTEPGEDGVFLRLCDDPRDLIRPYRDYSRDDIHGEEAYRLPDFYQISTTPAVEQQNPHDRTSMDDRGGPVLVGSGAIRYDSPGAGRLRLPSPPLAGQRLKRNRLGTGNRAEPGGPTSTPESDGRKGGTEAKDKDAEPPTWRVIGDDGTELKVKARKLREAKRAVKRLLGMAMAEPLPPGVRFCREG